MVRHRRGVTAGLRSALDTRGLGLVAVGGAVGATVRWGVVTLAGTDGSFPWWTLLVNVLGCAGLGMLTGAGRSAILVGGIGFCGGLTTFSTFAVEVAMLIDDGRPATGGMYVMASVVTGVAAFVVGRRSAVST